MEKAFNWLFGGASLLALGLYLLPHAKEASASLPLLNEEWWHRTGLAFSAAGVALVAVWVLETARAAKPDGVGHPYLPEQLCTRRKLKLIYALDGYALRKLTGLSEAAIIRRFRKNNRIIRCLEPFGDEDHIRGYYIIYPISKECEKRMQNGDIRAGHEIALEEILDTFGSGTALYISLVYGRDRDAGATAIKRLKSRILAIVRECGPQTIYMRPVTERGFQLAKRHKFSQLQNNPAIYCRTVDLPAALRESRSHMLDLAVPAGLAHYSKYKLAYQATLAVGGTLIILGTGLVFHVVGGMGHRGQLTLGGGLFLAGFFLIIFIRRRIRIATTPIQWPEPKRDTNDPPRE